MRRILATLFFFALSTLSVPIIGQAAVVGTDDANSLAYSGGWGNGSDGSTSGNAFGAWVLNSNNNPGGGVFAGHFIGDSTFLNPGNTGADINASGRSFGMYANPAGALSTASRSFNGALSVGDTFSLDLAANFRNGNKGLNLLAGATEIFNFNIGGDNYVVNNAASGNGSIGATYSSNTEFRISFTQTSALGGTWDIIRSGGVSDSDSGTYNGIASSFALYVASTEGGDQNNLFANNFQITAVPEPASLVMLAGCSAAFVIRRRLNKKAKAKVLRSSF
jgi:hypothetical protein